MGTLFEPSLSTSTMRAPYSAPSVSMADSLPSVNFGFDELRERMARFTHRFDSFIAEGRKRLLEERNQFRMNLAELQEDQKMKSRSIEILSQKATTHAQTLAKEAAETEEMHSAIASISAQRADRTTQRDRLRAEIASMKTLIAQRQEVQRAHAAKLDDQARFNNPELDFWVDYLCLRIEGAGQVDRLKFVFTHVDERDWEREAWFELCTETRDYDIGGCKPKLEKERVEACLEMLNQTRELGSFLKGMRALFVEAIRQ